MKNYDKILKNVCNISRKCLKKCLKKTFGHFEGLILDERNFSARFSVEIENLSHAKLSVENEYRT